jgi:hypothetical protein
MRFFSDNSDYASAVRRLSRGPVEPNPITYRMLHEDAAGMGLAEEFFTVSGINPDAAVKCNCNFDEGHEPACDIVAAHELRT